MVTQGECHFCGEKCKNDETHYCDKYIEHIITLGEEVEKQSADFTKAINKQDALKALKDLRKIDGTKIEI